MADKEQGQEVAVRGTSLIGGSWEPQTLTEVMTFCKWLTDNHADALPNDYRGKTGNIAIAAMMGRALGMPFMQSLMSIAVINGRPSIFGDGLLAVIDAQPDLEDIEEWDFEKIGQEKKACCTIKRKGRKPVTRTFSEADARAAGLWDKAGPWKQYPLRMLQMRARGFCARDAYPAALKGLILAEEAQDYVETTARPVPPEPKEIANNGAAIPAGTTEHNLASAAGDSLGEVDETTGEVRGAVPPAAQQTEMKVDAKAEGKPEQTTLLEGGIDRLINDGEIGELGREYRKKFPRDDAELRRVLRETGYPSIRHIKHKDFQKVLAAIKALQVPAAAGKSF